MNNKIKLTKKDIGSKVFWRWPGDKIYNDSYFRDFEGPLVKFSSYEDDINELGIFLVDQEEIEIKYVKPKNKNSIED